MMVEILREVLSFIVVYTKLILSAGLTGVLFFFGSIFLIDFLLKDDIKKGIEKYFKYKKFLFWKGKVKK